MYSQVVINNETYHVEYNYFPEEKDHNHYAPPKVEIELLFDELGEQPDDEELLKEIERELFNLNK